MRGNTRALHYAVHNSFLEFHNAASGVYALDANTKVLEANGSDVMIAAYEFGKGRCVYFSGFTYGGQNARLLYRVLMWATGNVPLAEVYLLDNSECECAYYSESGKLVVINNAETAEQTAVRTLEREYSIEIKPRGIYILEV